MWHARWTAAALAATALTIGDARPCHADPTPSVTLKIVVFDRSGLAADVVARAQAIAAGVFRRIGVDITFVTEDAFAAGYPHEATAILAYCRSVLQLHLAPVSAGGVTSPTALGLAPRGSRQVYAIASRITEAARQTGAAVPVVLGHVIAHEIGHLLLGPDSHTDGGLMQATFDLPRLADSHLGFDRAQGAQIRSALRRAPDPASVP